MVSWLLVVLMLTSVLPTSVLAEMVDAAASTAVEQALTEDAAVPEVPEDTENTDDAEQEAGPQSAVQSADIMVQAAAVTEISTAAEFAGMSATGSYKLTPLQRPIRRQTLQAPLTAITIRSHLRMIPRET